MISFEQIAVYIQFMTLFSFFVFTRESVWDDDCLTTVYINGFNYIEWRNCPDSNWKCLAAFDPSKSGCCTNESFLFD